jgi:aminoglycoside 2'-N-acetyltransferase I
MGALAVPTCVVTLEGPCRREDEDENVCVLRTPTSPALDVAGPIACDWRPGDVW